MRPHFLTLLPFTLSLLSMPTLAFAHNMTQSCRVVSINEKVNYLEEGLGVYGQNNVDQDSQQVQITLNSRGSLTQLSIGQADFAGIAVLETTSTEKYTDYTADSADANLSLKVRIYPSERGVILLKNEGASEWALLATIDCLSVTPLLNLYPDHAWSHKIQYDAVSKKVLEAMSYNDIAFEMGDGYYDLTDSTLYEVRTPTNQQLLGYLELVTLYYTEDNKNVQVLIRYDRNGLRVNKEDFSE